MRSARRCKSAHQRPHLGTRCTFSADTTDASQYGSKEHASRQRPSGSDAKKNEPANRSTRSLFALFCPVRAGTRSTAIPPPVNCAPGNNAPPMPMPPPSHAVCSEQRPAMHRMRDACVCLRRAVRSARAASAACDHVRPSAYAACNTEAIYLAT